MGSGASAEVPKEIAAATPEEVRAAINALDANTKKRLMSAMSALEGSETALAVVKSNDAEAAAVIALDDETEKKLKDIFDKTARGDGEINKRDLILTLRKDAEVADFFGLPQKIQQEAESRNQIEEFFQGIDENDDRSLSWDEMKQFYAQSRATGSRVEAKAIEGAKVEAKAIEGAKAETAKAEPEEDELDKKLKPAFADIDKNGSGFIEAKELAEVLKKMGLDMDDEAVAGVLKMADVNKDNRLDYAEYKALVGKAMK